MSIIGRILKSSRDNSARLETVHPSHSKKECDDLKGELRK